MILCVCDKEEKSGKSQKWGLSFLQRSCDSHQLCLLLLHLWCIYLQNDRRMVLEKEITSDLKGKGPFGMYNMGLSDPFSSYIILSTGLYPLLNEQLDLWSIQFLHWPGRRHLLDKGLKYFLIICIVSFASYCLHIGDNMAICWRRRNIFFALSMHKGISIRLSALVEVYHTICDGFIY